MFYFRCCKFLFSHTFIADNSSRPEPCTVSTIAEEVSKKSKILSWENTKTKFWNYFERIRTYNTKEAYVYLYSLQFILSQVTDLDPHESSEGRIRVSDLANRQYAA
jgi:hypothetical protein